MEIENFTFINEFLGGKSASIVTRLWWLLPRIFSSPIINISHSFISSNLQLDIDDVTTSQNAFKAKSILSANNFRKSWRGLEWDFGGDLSTQISRNSQRCKSSRGPCENFRDKLAKQESERISPAIRHRTARSPQIIARALLKHKNYGNNSCWPAAALITKLNAALFRNRRLCRTKDQHDDQWNCFF